MLSVSARRAQVLQRAEHCPALVADVTMEADIVSAINETVGKCGHLDSVSIVRGSTTTDAS